MSRIERNGRRRSLRRPKRSAIKESSASGRRRIVSTLWNVIVVIISFIFVSFKERITEAQTLTVLNILGITSRLIVS